MKTKKHDTRWMVSVALMAAIVIVLANTPLGMIQLPVIKATTVHIPVIIGAILRRSIRSLLSDQQHHGTDSFILCLLALYEHYRDSRSA